MMLAKRKFQYYSSLRIKKIREKEKKILVDGPVLVEEALKAGYKPEVVLMSHTYFAEDPNYYHRNSSKARFLVITLDEIRRISDTKNSQGVLGIFHVRKQPKFSSKFDIIVALENVSDPGNLGTLIRNCHWFDVKQTILSGECAEIYNPKTIRASAGSIFHTYIHREKDFYGMLLRCKKMGYDVVTADLEGDDLKEFYWPSRGILVFSNEAHGPSKELMEISDYFVSIPKYGGAESLNVASASAILLNNYIYDMKNDYVKPSDNSLTKTEER